MKTSARRFRRSLKRMVRDAAVRCAAAGAGPNREQPYLSYPGRGCSGARDPQTCAGSRPGAGAELCCRPGKGSNLGSPLSPALRARRIPETSPTSPGVGSGLPRSPDIAYYTTVNPTPISAMTNITAAWMPNVAQQGSASPEPSTGFPAVTTDYNGPVRSMNLWHHDVINDAFTGTVESHLQCQPVERGPRRRCRLALQRSETPILRSRSACPAISSPLTSAARRMQSLRRARARRLQPVDLWIPGHRDEVDGTAHPQIRRRSDAALLPERESRRRRPTYQFFNLWDFLNDAPRGETGQFNPGHRYALPGSAQDNARRSMGRLRAG